MSRERNPDRCKRREHAEYEILAHLLDGGDLSDDSLAELAARMGAGLDSQGNPTDRPAHDRFAAGAANLAGILEGMKAKRLKHLPDDHHDLEDDA